MSDKRLGLIIISKYFEDRFEKFQDCLNRIKNKDEVTLVLYDYTCNFELPNRHWRVVHKVSPSSSALVNIKEGRADALLEEAKWQYNWILDDWTEINTNPDEFLQYCSEDRIVNVIEGDRPAAWENELIIVYFKSGYIIPKKLIDCYGKVYKAIKLVTDETLLYIMNFLEGYKSTVVYTDKTHRAEATHKSSWSSGPKQPCPYPKMGYFRKYFNYLKETLSREGLRIAMRNAELRAEGFEGSLTRHLWMKEKEYQE